MVSERVDINRDFKTTLSVGLVILVFAFLSVFVLTAGGGLSDPVFKESFTLYAIIGGLGLSFIFVVDLVNYLFGVRRLKTIVHDPEEGLLSGNKVVGNPWLLTLLFFILFTPIAFVLGKVSNTFFSSITVPVQSVVNTAKAGLLPTIWSVSIFPALAENLFIFIALALVYTWNFNKNYKNRSGLFYFLNLLVIPIVFAVLWQLFHLAVYGSSESSMAFVFGFGLIGIFVSLLCVSILPWIVIHFLTNFMVVLQKYGLMSSDRAVVWIIVFEIFCIMAFFLVYRLDKRRYD